jgi:hypothetical protein
MLEIVSGGELIVRGGGEPIFDAWTETGAENSKSPKSSKDILDWDSPGGPEGADTKSSNGSVSMRDGAAVGPGGGGREGIGGESREGTSAWNACCGRPENEVCRR